MGRTKISSITYRGSIGGDRRWKLHVGNVRHPTSGASLWYRRKFCWIFLLLILDLSWHRHLGQSDRGITQSHFRYLITNIFRSDMIVSWIHMFMFLYIMFISYSCSRSCSCSCPCPCRYSCSSSCPCMAMFMFRFTFVSMFTWQCLTWKWHGHPDSHSETGYGRRIWCGSPQHEGGGGPNLIHLDHGKID
jgi:hypothetical protein